MLSAKGGGHTENSVTYTESEKKAHISELQGYLRVISQADESIVRIVPTGVYDTRTAEAVTRFQQSRGLPATGKTDLETWERIFAAYNDVNIPESCFSVISEQGAEGHEVYILQAVLGALGQRYGNIGKVGIDGVYGDETASAVRSIQSAAGVKTTGNVDAKTWEKIIRLYSVNA